jgi:UDPglucose 6-dehydrogenase
MKTIGVVGTGFVGTAVIEGMKSALEIMSYDKKDAFVTSILEVDFGPNRGDKHDRVSGDTDVPFECIVGNVDGPIFVCVPTPMNADGSCDCSIVADVVMCLNTAAKKQNKQIDVVIKSTVIPGTTDYLDSICSNSNVCFNPEFLVEKTSIEDFKNQKRIVLGGKNLVNIKKAYNIAFPQVEIVELSSSEAEMVKYVTNCFLSVKVAFANEIKQICDKLTINYSEVINCAIKDKRLGESHWAVPGPDGLLGFGGKCFPKDLSALMVKSVQLHVDPKVMRGAWDKNKEIRH